ncbi:hypothetical protein VE00_10398 [Pseudogymnoascus sp. WSF 3629]|nr:hypothetical protein VE00_10398 [Pseudogymnoascus sp. WSF 3629]
MAPPPFAFNIAFTLEVNNNNNDTTINAGGVTLTAAELWQGIKRGGRNPNDFADYVSACDVLSGGRKEFRRRLTLADGAVHTPAGATLDQDVWISDYLSVLSQTVDTGAKSTFHLSYGAAEGNTETHLFLTAMYELKLAHVQPETEEAKDIETNYTALARGACRSAVEKIRLWKVQGKLAAWAEEDKLLDDAAEKETAGMDASVSVGVGAKVRASG